MKIYLDTVGCRLNQSEIETFARQFRSAGHEIVSGAGEADLVVINTCTVTSQAASDSRQKVRQAVRLGAGEIVLTGCWSTLEPEQAKALPNVRTLIPNGRKDELVRDLLGLTEPEFDLEPLERQPLPGKHMRTRAFIKVQDGCDNRCTFCITTLARGDGISRSIPQVLSDIQAALQGGTQEVVLTGVHLGSWGKDRAGSCGQLGDLIQSILSETDVSRLRLSSLEPWDLDDNFFELWQDQRLCRHLHLPLQSGSAGVLRRMARKVTPQSYAALLTAARAAIPDVAITTDLIAGFPGETDDEFAETLEFVKRMNFSGGHVFTYSARAGTVAAGMLGQVPHNIRKSRSAALRELLSESRQTYAERFLGKKLKVLWENSGKQSDGAWLLEGLTDNYLHVCAKSPQPRWNQIDSINLFSTDSTGLMGEINL
ncbi:MAG: tRNA (N(6)-L-threonylcarbamoyladenosine(37)-C(2))-methylthiotransferase MtaB [Chloroflexi bacterium GWB2_49_20]|nr:MAG: tRNA (N(6)-L-threonylcarbamoyladenosine(37)-C(2))-methylthiotransferase MtaB [Chloroflexi bacterium GWB2_49_20]OGN77653.1 MAG: tRNA (N(6)-L-threonylcarbamoyladenosine(37)-C(2))-methylthiotransferase MtaB [Chloroflexi bacterium GWC2_49_37]OGN86429.1 MAG: tRNA (N(6)-L-threonylcarbamoyladenosine(37)-C(2))-methylthiotransferase MtaB [Chloroflexi bacterium GWD2_49_16]HBG74668.1 tRNA (N(6)-L-threonylcarbamoyladenosine(37)-C(2))-methylthiotransferase MtaB [Anaerolineae bacterium]